MVIEIKCLPYTGLNEHIITEKKMHIYMLRKKVDIIHLNYHMVTYYLQCGNFACIKCTIYMKYIGLKYIDTYIS